MRELLYSPETNIYIYIFYQCINKEKIVKKLNSKKNYVIEKYENKLIFLKMVFFLLFVK